MLGFKARMFEISIGVTVGLKDRADIGWKETIYTRLISVFDGKARGIVKAGFGSLESEGQLRSPERISLVVR